MKYYALKNSNDIKEIGKYDQSESAHNITSFWKDVEQGVINEVMNVPEPVVHKKARLTSYLTSVPISKSTFLILKKDFIDVLNKFNIGEYLCWDMKVHHDKEVLDYYNLFHLLKPVQESIIDFKNSEFLVGKLGDWRDKSIRKPVELKNYQQYDSLIKKLRKSEDRSQIRCNKLVFDFSKINLDMFRLANMPYFGGGYYVSEKLKLAIEKEGFSGMTFKEIEEVDKRIQVIYCNNIGK